MAGLQSSVLFTVILGALTALLVFGEFQVGSRLASAAAPRTAALYFSVSGQALSAASRIAPLLTALRVGAIIVWVGGLIPLAVASEVGID